MMVEEDRQVVAAPVGGFGVEGLVDVAELNVVRQPVAIRDTTQVKLIWPECHWHTGSKGKRKELTKCIINRKL
jgi:hypothetical protein